MFAGLDMKVRKLGILFAIGLWLLTGLAPLSAMPKYTDKETALALAKVLDKGKWDRFTIASTYVQNASIKDYYVSVILSNGRSMKWYLSDVHKWSRDDRLRLSDNRVLIFPDARSSKFNILDKNEFHKLALSANVYQKTYQAGDPLEGQSFRYHIKAFNLISPQEKAFGRDPRGSKYRYVVDLFNGQSELLTYEDAYNSLRESRFLTEKEANQTTLGKAYQVTKILPYPKGTIEEGVAQFGVEVQFDRPIQLTGKNFPMEIYEHKDYDPRTKKFTNRFVMDITIPNSEVNVEVPAIENLEYLQSVRVVKNPSFPKRLYLRANFTPKVLDIPPVIYKNSDNSIYVNFFALIDQSVMTRSMLMEDKQLEALQRQSKRQIRVKKALKTDSDYGKAFIAAMEKQKQATTLKDAGAKIQTWLEAIKEFEAAALYADDDTKLYNALNRRNELRGLVINATLDHVRSRLEMDRFGGSHPRELMDRLDMAESFTKEPRILQAVEELREQLIAAQAE